MEFNLDDMPSPKPVMGVDDLLLGLTHHWSRDRSVFPTEDDRLDLPTAMLFQAFTACRPAELVDASKARGGIDPLVDDADGDGFPDSVKTSRDDMVVNIGELESEDDDEEEEGEDSDSIFDDENGYGSDVTDDTDIDGDERDDVDYNHTAEAVDAGHSNRPEVDRFGNLVRKHKVLCYEDITLWIVKDPKQGRRDVLAMEVLFRFHKGVDRKPKPYACNAPRGAILELIWLTAALQHHFLVS